MIALKELPKVLHPYFHLLNLLFVSEISLIFHRFRQCCFLFPLCQFNLILNNSIIMQFYDVSRLENHTGHYDRRIIVNILQR